MGRNGHQAKRVSQCSATADARISSAARGAGAHSRSDVRLLWVQHKRGASFQGLTVSLVSITVIEEDSVAAAQRCLSVTENIPGEPNSRRRIEQMTLHAAARSARSAALNESVVQKLGIAGVCRRKECPGDGIHQSSRARRIELGRVRRVKSAGLKVVGVLLFFVVRAKQT